MSNPDPDATQTKLKINLGPSRTGSVHMTSPDITALERKDSQFKFEKIPINERSNYMETSNDMSFSGMDTPRYFDRIGSLDQTPMGTPLHKNEKKSGFATVMKSRFGHIIGDKPDDSNVLNTEEVKAIVIPESKKKKKKKCNCLGRKRVSQRGRTMQMIRENIKGDLTRAMTMNSKITGKLLRIVTKQAIEMKTPTAKIFYEALSKVNPEAIARAKLEMQGHKVSFGYKLMKYARITAKRLSEPIRPGTRFIVYWKIIMVVTVMLQSILCTYAASFDTKPNVSFQNDAIVWMFCLDIIFVVDIVLTFRTGYYHQGELIKKKRAIAGNYLKNTFLLDILSLLSLLSYFSNVSIYFMLFPMLRLYHIPNHSFTIEEYFQFGRRISSLFKVMKLVILVLLIAHYFACIFYAVTKDEQLEETWLFAYGLDTKPNDDKYVASLYFTVTTMATIGYGDIVPRSRKERIVNIVVMITASILFGYTLSSIGSLILEISNYSSEAK